MYVSDQQRIELAILPALLQYVMLQILRDEPKEVIEKSENLSALMEYLQMLGFFKDNSKINRRLIKLIEKAHKYFVKNKFCTRKIVLCIQAWAEALDEAGGLFIHPETRFKKEVLTNIVETIQRGRETIPDFDKIEASAEKHATKLHKLIQDEGYF